MIVPAVMIGQHQSNLDFTGMCRIGMYFHTRVIYIVQHLFDHTASFTGSIQNETPATVVMTKPLWYVLHQVSH